MRAMPSFPDFAALRSAEFSSGSLDEMGHAAGLSGHGHSTSSIGLSLPSARHGSGSYPEASPVSGSVPIVSPDYGRMSSLGLLLEEVCACPHWPLWLKRAVMRTAV